MKKNKKKEKEGKERKGKKKKKKAKKKRKEETYFIGFPREGTAKFLRNSVPMRCAKFFDQVQLSVLFQICTEVWVIGKQSIGKSYKSQFMWQIFLRLVMLWIAEQQPFSTQPCHCLPHFWWNWGECALVETTKKLTSAFCLSKRSWFVFSFHVCIIS